MTTSPVDHSSPLTDSTSGDAFRIRTDCRVLLVVRAAFPVVLIGTVLWAISDEGIGLTEMGPFILLALAALGVYNIVQLARWFAFKITLSDSGIRVRDRMVHWSEVVSASAGTATQFTTFIELVTKEGAHIKIPAAIEQSAFVLSVCEKHLPQLTKRA